jgi:hypothetical protein
MFFYLHDHLTHLLIDPHDLRKQEVSGRITPVNVALDLLRKKREKKP